MRLGHAPDVGQYGRWMAAVLSLRGRSALLSHRSAAALWGLQVRRVPMEIDM